MLSLSLLCLKARSATAVPEVEFSTSCAFGRARATPVETCYCTEPPGSGSLLREERWPGVAFQPRQMSPPLAVRREHQDLQLFLLPFCTSKHLSSGKSHSSHPKHVCATALTVQEAVQVWPRCRSCTAPANRWGRGNLPILPGTNPQSTPIKCMLNYSHS